MNLELLQQWTIDHPRWKEAHWSVNHAEKERKTQEASSKWCRIGLESKDCVEAHRIAVLGDAVHTAHNSTSVNHVDCAWIIDTRERLHSHFLLHFSPDSRIWLCFEKEFTLEGTTAENRLLRLLVEEHKRIRNEPVSRGQRRESNLQEEKRWHCDTRLLLI